MSFRLGYMVPEFPGQTHIFFWREIEALRKKGVDVQIVSTKRPYPLVCQHSFAEQALSETHYLFPPRPLGLIAGAATVGSRFADARHYINRIQGMRSIVQRCGLAAGAVEIVNWARKNGIEHIHGHSCANTAHILALANAISDIPYSLTLHGDLDVYGTDHPLKMKKAKFVSAVGKHLVQQIVQEVGIPRERVHSTLMGLDTRYVAERISSGRCHDRKILRAITVARLSQTKGHRFAIEAIKRAVASGIDIHYTIVGEGPDKATIRSQIAELKLLDRVTLAGSLPEEEVFDRLAEADLFILPSFGSGEAWPVSVMEAMAAGLPVISTRIGATEEMIRSGRDGVLVRQRSSDDIFLAIRTLACDRDLRESIGNEARATAMRRFDIALTSDALLNSIRH